MDNTLEVLKEKAKEEVNNYKSYKYDQYIEKKDKLYSKYSNEVSESLIRVIKVNSPVCKIRFLKRKLAIEVMTKYLKDNNFTYIIKNSKISLYNTCYIFIGEEKIHNKFLFIKWTFIDIKNKLISDWKYDKISLFAEIFMVIFNICILALILALINVLPILSATLTLILIVCIYITNTPEQ